MDISGRLRSATLAGFTLETLFAGITTTLSTRAYWHVLTVDSHAKTICCGPFATGSFPIRHGRP